MNYETIEISGKEFNAAIRMADDLLPVLAYPEELRENFKAYFMFRDVYYSKTDRVKIIQNKLRYDITIIPPGRLGSEFIKTYGHIHPIAENNLSYTEIYDVLEGEAVYLLQKSENNRVIDFFVVEALKGDKVIIPPNYGHVTINASNKVLKMANWVYRDFSSDYMPYKKYRGACYYLTEDGWVKNDNYSNIPEMRILKPVIPKELGLKKSEEMYKLIKTPAILEFLYRPSENLKIFEEAFKEK